MSGQIITPDNPAPNAPASITPEVANRMAYLINRRNELGKISLATPQSVTEQKAVSDELVQMLYFHAAELFNAWMIIKAEYEPLVGALDGVFSRIMAFKAQQQAMAMAQQQSKPSAQVAKAPIAVENGPEVSQS